MFSENIERRNQKMKRNNYLASMRHYLEMVTVIHAFPSKECVSILYFCPKLFLYHIATPLSLDFSNRGSKRTERLAILEHILVGIVV